ncbi:hypothetical protein AMATHDRAFT_73535 [Amanita thiersii Skay4041]|uniref:Uncharacterized protein n=1 Tax=Amanita thiersii Skay4041 TaxID=703135 RepID=A0A2A9NZ94_9AGAR|nr:hypothetical protein AMATHDRAFT_73535 [Amanita thiersii Skay4041]
MATRPTQLNPLPIQTPPPLDSPLPPSLRTRKSKRRKRSLPSLDLRASTSKTARQVIAFQDQIEEARRQCQLLSGNNVISCFPKANTIIPQHEWAAFVWNSRLPEFTQTNLVDIYLFRADSQQEILRFRNQINPFGQAGSITARVDDRWWGEDGRKWNGTNVTFPFYWLISRSDEELNGSQLPQSIFSAVQTTYADSIVASMLSSSLIAASASSAAAAASSALASLSSLTAAQTPPTAGPSSTSSGSLQHPNGGSSFPHWAIAVIVVLGFLAIAATCILIFLILRRLRRRQNGELDSNRNSMGSASPMMADMQQQSPLIGATAPLGTARGPSSIGHHQQTGAPNAPPSVVVHDGASTASADLWPLSGADAAIMADAFRKILRKPDLTGRVEEDLPEHHDGVKEDLIQRELAEEGRDIRSVSSSRGVRVETLSDHGDTDRERERD